MSTYPQFDLGEGQDLTPAQWIDLRGSTTVGTPEKRLALAVLESAIRDFRARVGGENRVRAAVRHFEAEKWLFRSTTAPFSFDVVCDLLGIEPTGFRERLQTWDGQLARRSAVNGNGGCRPTVKKSRAGR